MLDLNQTQNVMGHSTTLWNIASTGLQIGNSLFNFFNQRSATKDYNRQVAANYRTQMGMLENQQVQQVKAASVQQSRLARMAQAERSRVVTALGESGASGPLAQRLATEARFAHADASQQIDTNLNNQLAQGYHQGEAMRSQAKASFRSEPSLLGLGLQIGGSVLNGMNPDIFKKQKVSNASIE